MNRKYWWYFAVVQALGLLGGIESLYLLQDGLLWTASLLLLLPGSLSFLPSFLAPVLAAHPFVVWMPIWPLYLTTFAANSILFSLVLRVSTRRRVSKRAGLTQAS